MSLSVLAEQLQLAYGADSASPKQDVDKRGAKRAAANMAGPGSRPRSAERRSSSNSADGANASGNGGSQSEGGQDVCRIFLVFNVYVMNGIKTLCKCRQDPKKNRPKRGQYRRYDKNALAEAVLSVRRGEMSVHRAGSHYGVPHSTLEYKVNRIFCEKMKNSRIIFTIFRSRNETCYVLGNVTWPRRRENRRRIDEARKLPRLHWKIHNNMNQISSLQRQRFLGMMRKIRRLRRTLVRQKYRKIQVRFKVENLKILILKLVVE